jgi:hypothetical protein
MGPFHLIVATLADQLEQVTELKHHLEDQSFRKDQLTWWVNLHEETDWDEEWIKRTALNVISRSDLLTHIIQKSTEGILVYLDQNDVLDSRALETLVGFLRFNRDKMACYLPLALDGERIPQSAWIFKADSSELATGCVGFRIEALKELEVPWAEDEAEALTTFCAQHAIWPATSQILVERGKVRAEVA